MQLRGIKPRVGRLRELALEETAIGESLFYPAPALVR